MTESDVPQHADAAGTATDDDASVETGDDALDADEGEPEITAFAGSEEILRPSPRKDGQHGYGYE